MTVECALAKLAYLLSKPELSSNQVRKLMGRSLRGELTIHSPAPTFTSPVPAGDRLRTLFSKVIDCAVPVKSIATSPSVRTSALSNPDGETELPEEFEAPWPATLKDAEMAEQAILPYLLGQAAARADSLLDQLISSLVVATSSETNSNQISSTSTRIGAEGAGSDRVMIALLNEPCTPMGQTPLHIAVSTGQANNVELLLNSGASVHLRDRSSHSALFYAAATRSNRSSEGESHIDEQGMMRIVKLLREAGAHLGQIEIERGDVGIEVCKAEKTGDRLAIRLWETAADREELDRAKKVLRAFLE